VGPRADVYDVENRKFLALPGLELRPLGCPARRKEEKEGIINENEQKEMKKKGIG
jgi:hypothetical protein